MSTIPPRKPITPTIVVWLGMLVGFVGLVMVILGLGGVAPFQFQMPGVGVNVRTTSAGLVVMVIGFAVALTPIGLAMWVDGRRNTSAETTAAPYITNVLRGDQQGLSDPSAHPGADE